MLPIEHIERMTLRVRLIHRCSRQVILFGAVLLDAAFTFLLMVLILTNEPAPGGSQKPMR
jgi:hypothetical protein